MLKVLGLVFASKVIYFVTNFFDNYGMSSVYQPAFLKLITSSLVSEVLSTIVKRLTGSIGLYVIEIGMNTWPVSFLISVSMACMSLIS